MTVDQATADAVELIDRLHARHGEPIHVMGHSLGAFIALAAAALRPDDVASVALLAPVIDNQAGDKIVWKRLQEAVAAAPTRTLQRQLVRLGPPPYPSRKALARVSLVSQTGGIHHRRRSGVGRLVLASITASWRTPEYSLIDLAVLGLLPVAFTISSGLTVGAVPAAVDAGSGSPAAERLLRLVLIAGGLFTAIQVLAPFRLRAAWNLGWSVEIGLQQRVMAASTGPVGIAHLEDPRTLDRIAVARGIDHDWVGPTSAIEAMSNVASRYLTGIGSVLVLSSWRWWFGPLMASMYIISGSRLRTGFRAVIETMYLETGTFRRATYYRDFAVEPLAAKETRVFDLGAWLRERYRESWLRAMTEVWQTRKRFRSAFLVLMTMTVLTKGGAYLYIGLSGARGDITLAAAAVLLNAVQGLADGFGAIGDDSVKIGQGSLGVPAALSLERDTASSLQIDARGRLPPRDCLSPSSPSSR